MKIINVKYTADGENNLNNKPFVIAGENLGICVKAEFPETLTGDVKAYWSNTGAGNGVEDCGSISFQEGINFVELSLTDEMLNYGTLSIGFEISDGTSDIRFKPFKINVNRFIPLVRGTTPNDYVVSIEIAGVEHLPTGAAPYIENIGTFKNVKLMFGIPDGKKGEPGTPSETVDKLTTARKINGVSFDGSADITIKDDTKIPVLKINQPDGVAGLDKYGKISVEHIPNEFTDFVQMISDFAISPVMQGLTEQLLIKSRCCIGCTYYKVFSDGNDISDYLNINAPFVTAFRGMEYENIRITFYDNAKNAVGTVKLLYFNNQKFGFFERIGTDE